MIKLNLHHGVEADAEEPHAQLDIALNCAKHEVVTDKSENNHCEETGIGILDIFQEHVQERLHGLSIHFQ